MGLLECLKAHVTDVTSSCQTVAYTVASVPHGGEDATLLQGPLLRDGGAEQDGYWRANGSRLHSGSIVLYLGAAGDCPFTLGIRKSFCFDRRQITDIQESIAFPWQYFNEKTYIYNAY